MIERKFDRLVSFDSRSRNYPVRRLVRGLEPMSKVWPCSKVLDQGSDGSCVGHGIAHDLIAEPLQMLWVDHDYAVKIYKRAQFIDEWPGEDYQGTSVNAGLKATKEFRNCQTWNWSFSHLDTQLGLSHVRPGIAGTNWYTGMITPDSNGFIHATGQNEGGHCYLFVGINVEQQYFTIHNSWGSGWGQNGQAKISFDDYEKLRTNEGEMAFIVGEFDTGGNVPPEPPPPNNGCIFARTYTGFGDVVARLLGSSRRFKSYKKGGKT